MESVLCAICFNSYRPLIFSVAEPCGHVFHKKCLRQLSAESQSLYATFRCPKCRRQINKYFQLFVDYDENSNAKKLASKNAKQAQEIKNLKSYLDESSSKITNLNLKMASDKVEMNKKIVSLNSENRRQNETMFHMLDDLCSARRELTAIKKIQKLEAKKLKSSNNYNFNNPQIQENINVDDGPIYDEDYWEEEAAKQYYQEYDDYYCNHYKPDDGQGHDYSNTEPIKGSTVESACETFITIFIILATTLYVLK